MFGDAPTQSLPQLSSIQLLQLRAQQHMANADASSASLPAAPIHPHSQAGLQGLTPQLPSGSQTDPPSQVLGAASAPTGGPPPPQAGPTPAARIEQQRNSSPFLATAAGTVPLSSSDSPSLTASTVWLPRGQAVMAGPATGGCQPDR